MINKIKKYIDKYKKQDKEEARIPMSIDKEQKEIKKDVLEIYCPFCSSKNHVKRGTREKKRERVQLYLCKDCERTFTPGIVKGKHYPQAVVLEGISLYCLGYSYEQACRIVNQGQGEQKMLQPSSLSNWVKQYEPFCAYSRMRPFGIKMYKPENVLDTTTLAHRQLYRFQYHKAKTKLIIEEDFKHHKFMPMKEFLDLVTVECPHEYFSKGKRASETPIAFSLKQMIIRPKENYATKVCKLVMETVEENKKRHEALQKFMIATDSVTVATEVPVYLRREDLLHMQRQLGFELYEPARFKALAKQEDIADKELSKALLKEDELPKIITGHIDILQIRNGVAHIMDYKPRAKKESPINQLVLYALALSRLSGLRVFNFKCAWFDEQDYFEFYPLHAVYKAVKNKRRKNIITADGVYELNQQLGKIKKWKYDV